MTKPSRSLILAIAAIVIGTYAAFAAWRQTAPHSPAAASAVHMSITSTGDAMIRVSIGTRVTLSATSPDSGVFHVHGYDIKADAVPGQAQDIAFVANRAGWFPIHFHAAKYERQIGVLQVDPAQ